MNSLKLNGSLVTNTWSSRNQFLEYGFHNPIYPEIVVQPLYQKEVPVLFYNTYNKMNPFGETFIPVSYTELPFSGRALTKPKMMELLQTCRCIQKVLYGKKWYYAAQGFLSEAQNEDIFENIVFLHSVNRFLDREEIVAEDINMYVNKRYTGDPEYKKEEVLIKDFMKLCEGSITISEDPLRRFEKRLLFKSKTVNGLKRELNFYVKSALREIKDENVKSIVSRNTHFDSVLPVLFDPHLAEIGERRIETGKWVEPILDFPF